MKRQATAGLVLLAFAGLAGEAASAESATLSVTPWYVGLGLGRTYTKIPQQAIDGQTAFFATALGGTTSGTTTDRTHSTEGKVFLGYSFDPHIAVELGYATLGNARASGLISNGGGFTTLGLKYKLTAPFIDAVGRLPLNEKWSLIGRAGIAYARTSSTTTLSGFSGSPSASETKLREKFGAGVDYQFSSSIVGRVEWENYRMPDPLTDESFRVNAAVLSVMYHF